MSRIVLLSAATFLCLSATVLNGQESSLAFECLKELDVFIGEWEGTMTVPEGARQSESRGELAGRKVTLSETVRWAPGKSGQVVELRWHGEGQKPILGVSLVGWDQGRKQIVDTSYTTDIATMLKSADKSCRRSFHAHS